MKNKVYKTLCWVLAVSLVWLPLSASADTLLSTTDKNGCHEMDSHQSAERDVTHSNTLSPMASRTAVTAAMIDNFQHEAVVLEADVHEADVHEVMTHEDCCGHCDDNCADCIGATSCGNRISQVSALILAYQYSSRANLFIQLADPISTQHNNLIITPDIRPPIV